MSNRIKWIDNLNQLKIKKFGGFSNEFVGRIKNCVGEFNGYISNLETQLRNIGEDDLANILTGREEEPI